MKRILFVITALLITSLASAQKVLNNYKYVVIPVQYKFQKTENQYQLNSLLKHKFNQLGLEAYLETDDLPKEVKINSCSYLKPIINAKSNMFATKATIDLVNCDGKVSYSTREGKSNSKSIRASYLEAVRASLKSFDGYQYRYEPKAKEEGITVAQEIEVVDKKKDDSINDSDYKELSTDVSKADQKHEPIKKERIFLNHNTDYIFKGDKYAFQTVLDGPFYKNIVKKGTGISIGTLSKSSKKGIYHVILDKQRGIGYYDENGSFLVEIIDLAGEVQLYKFQELSK